MDSVQPNLARYAAAGIRGDMLTGFIPLSVCTILELVGFYRDQHMPGMVEGLSEIMENNPGCGNRSIGVFIY